MYINPSWLSWNSEAVPSIARRIYEERTFHLMPILADALEEAGCIHTAILEHCRLESRHARGCWVLDSILGLK